MTRSALAATLVLAGALLLPAPVRAGAALEPYRTLVRTAEGTRLLAEARAAMRAHFGLGSPAPASAADLPDWPGAPAGLYVTLVNGRSTRACVGAAAPPGATLGESVRMIAVQALQLDRRRAPVRAGELDRLRIVIAFAGPPEPLAEPWSVALEREGLLVQSPRGTIAFLPGEVRTVAYALREARRVLGDPRDATYARFDVVTLTETSPTPSRGAAARERTDPDDSP